MKNNIFLFFILLTINLLIPLWFWIAIIPFLFFLVISSNYWNSFWRGGLVSLFVWLFYFFYLYIFYSGEIITKRTAQLFNIDSNLLIILIIGLISFIIGGLSSLLGSAISELIRKK